MVRTRRLFTTDEALAGGVTKDALRWATEAGRIVSLGRGVYGAGPEPPTALDWARAAVLRGGGEARGHLAGVLHGLDSVCLDDRPTRRTRLPADRVVVVGGVRCADGLATLVDLAATLDDLTWEQALESALRKRLTTVAAIDAVVAALGGARVSGTARIWRVLVQRPPGAPATESLLETLMVQRGRLVPDLPPPVRQLDVYNAYGEFVARVDLAWPGLGLFIDLDGQHHSGQPVYDARRETAVVASTGWLCGRFTWDEVVRWPTTTARRLAGLVDQARRRPLPAA